MPEDEWAKLRRSIARLLRARGHTTAGDVLERYPFDLRAGTNYFEDEFCVLQADVSLDQYVELEEVKAKSKDVFKEVASAASELGPFTRFVVATLATDDSTPPVPPPSLTVTSDSVERALADAEQLLRTQGPPSALDRVHTALHGYLRIVLDGISVQAQKSAPITDLFRSLREHHPVLQDQGSRSEEITRLIRAASTMVDTLNTLRNQASGAHPDGDVLTDAEAMLAINCARTLLHYLDAKLNE